MSFLILSTIVILNTIFLVYVNLRQYKKLGEKMPKTVSKLYNEESWLKSTNYNKDKLLFYTFCEIAESIKEIAFLYYVEYFYSLFGGISKNPKTTFILFYFFANQIFKIPFNAFFDFYIENKHGFNKKTVKLFIYDFFIGIFLTFLIGSPVLYVFFYIVEKYLNFEIYLGSFVAFFQLFMLWIYPIVISPLYNKFVPLESSTLKKAVEDLALKVGFKLDKIQVMDGSRRSGHSNAYFTGFGKHKRIVFYNTILNQLEEDEIVAVLAHELGHWHCSHLFKQIGLSFVQIFGFVYLFKTFLPKEHKIAIYFLKFLVGSSAIQVPVVLFVNLITRKFEREADRFAVKYGFGEKLKDALIKLQKENLGAPIVDFLYSAISYQHPHIYERLDLIDQELKKIK